MTVGVVGLGLVGGSLALDLCARDVHVVGTDVEPTHRQGAAAEGVHIVDSAAEVARVSDLVVVAVPPVSVADVVAEVRDTAPDVVVTDVASVKAPAALGLDVRRANGWFVGGHPMAGTERTGFRAARRGLLAGATWLLTPGPDTHVEAFVRTVELVLQVDAIPVVVDPVEHDRLVAAVSHVSHLLAFGLHGVASRRGAEVVDLVAGPSFRDATRVAASDPGFWGDVTQRNRDAVVEVLEELRAWLTDAVQDSPDELVTRLATARRQPLPSRPDERGVTIDDGGGTLAPVLDGLRRDGAAGYAIVGVTREASGAVGIAMARR